MTSTPASPALTEADQAMRDSLIAFFQDRYWQVPRLITDEVDALLAGPLATLRATLREREAEIERLKEEAADYQASFDLRWRADMRAIERWHAAGGHRLTWPDHADLVVWLVTQWLGEPGAEAERIPSFGFARGAVVREATNGPNMLVVRGLGETTVVIVIEGDEGGKVRLRERPTAALRQVLAAGDYAEMRPAASDWEPPALAQPDRLPETATGGETV
jgi:hypothetical protein